jgi:hypothetical protein
MATNTTPIDPLERLQSHLAAQIALKDRSDAFDLDDRPEREALAPFEPLARALAFLDEAIREPWRRANDTAKKHQKRHRRLASVAIVTGGTAVALAIVQLALLKSWPQWKNLAGLLEGIAVVAGLVAVLVGLLAKFDRHWLGQRHRAQRLRMLKFRSLGWAELWCGRESDWRERVRAEIAAAGETVSFKQVKAWSLAGETSPDSSAPSDCATAPELVRALAIYYGCKRLQFQADYFLRQSSRYRHRVGHWPHLGLPLFFLSVLAVLLHFLAEYLGHREPQTGGAAHAWELVAIWGVAAAALIPVVSLGVRAWFSAFELPRSASLFEAKHYALAHAAARVRQDAPDLPATLRLIAQNEHFLEHEHREWLRLLLDAEWFL